MNLNDAFDKTDIILNGWKKSCLHEQLQLKKFTLHDKSKHMYTNYLES
jgi:hypothetical protein